MLSATEQDETPLNSAPHGDRQLHVFVHLAHGFGRSSWKQRWEAGEIVGINDADPYGYQHAASMGCVVQQSEDFPEGRLGRLLRLGLRAVLGFDLVHAWRNRRDMFNAEVIWTHTESQALAVLTLMRLRAGPQPRLIAQTVWLMDAWDGYAAPRRWFYKHLLQSADILTFHSTLALKKAHKVLPQRPVQLVRYGIRADQGFGHEDRSVHTPLRLVMMGNDKHRDWLTFIKAFANRPNYEARLITRADLRGALEGVTNISQEKFSSNEELFALFTWADALVVCLKQNLHASGITVIEEAVLWSLPVICSDLGGLESYFTAEEITYVPAGDPDAVRAAADRLAANDHLRHSKAARALAKMKTGNINARGFVREHVEISHQLLGR